MFSKLHDFGPQNTVLFIVLPEGSQTSFTYVALDSNLHSKYDPQMT